eukprot:TRINITY_DN12854_c0_g1_i1.p1 TRINITY_DN12854_c0_g1~~TRINITY_DN12854_c0_g1_i1.p1  ORF type:complete len:163 (-),score=28.87 TRINITY_DN12854_c0_g1_i1:70-558(-)
MICVMGPSVSGKSCLIKRFVRGYYKEGAKYEPTMGDTYNTTVDFSGKSQKLQIRDGAGLYHFASLQTADINSGAVFIVTYGIDNRFQWEDVPDVIESIKKIKGHPPIALVGTKLDLAGDRYVTYQMGSDLANQLNCAFFECSSASNENVTKVFEWAAQFVEK